MKAPNSHNGPRTPIAIHMNKHLIDKPPEVPTQPRSLARKLIRAGNLTVYALYFLTFGALFIGMLWEIEPLIYGSLAAIPVWMALTVAVTLAERSIRKREERDPPE